jgi:hypothetical protein
MKYNMMLTMTTTTDQQHSTPVLLSSSSYLYSGRGFVAEGLSRRCRQDNFVVVIIILNDMVMTMAMLSGLSFELDMMSYIIQRSKLHIIIFKVNGVDNSSLLKPTTRVRLYLAIVGIWANALVASVLP